MVSAEHFNRLAFSGIVHMFASIIVSRSTGVLLVPAVTVLQECCLSVSILLLQQHLSHRSSDSVYFCHDYNVLPALHHIFFFFCVSFDSRDCKQAIEQSKVFSVGFSELYVMD